MGIIDLQHYLVSTFTACIHAAQAEMTVINDLFENFSATERQAIFGYLAETTVTSDLSLRDENRRNLYVIPSYPVVGVPFPQIGVYLPGEEMQDFPMGQSSGAEPTPVMDGAQIVGWRQEYMAVSAISYRADIFCNTPEETVWLSRLCQRALFSKVLALDAMGVKEPRISMADLRLEQEHFPSQVFARGISLSAKAFHTWHETIPAYTGTSIVSNPALKGG